MDIEIVEFYPAEKQTPGQFIGSVHVLLKDFGLNIRGIFAKFKIDEEKNIKWKFIFPSRIQDGNWFPIVIFSDKELQKEFIRITEEKAKEFILKKMNSKPEKSEKEKVKQEDKVTTNKKPANLSLKTGKSQPSKIQQRTIKKPTESQQKVKK